MRNCWLLLSVLGTIISALPAEAAKLTSWQFDTNQNKLVFSTNDGVQPTAKLISNPSRVVIDLPGTQLGKPTTHKQIGSAVKSVRAGQFNAQTARLVVELEAGYTIDPQQVRVVGNTPNQWSVQLPNPQRAPGSTTRAIAATSNPNFQITQNGLYVRLDAQQTGTLQTQRSKDGRQIAIDLPGIALPSALAAQNLAVSRYGVSSVQFTQISPSMARMTLNVTADSPDWQASFSRFGGLVLVPMGGMRSIRDSNPKPEFSTPVANTPPSVVNIPVPPPRNPLPPRVSTPTPPRVSTPTPPRVSPPAPPQVSPPTRTPSPSLPTIPNSRVLVTIDPGHGGRDPGAIGRGGLREIDVVLPISKDVARILEQQGVKVQMTRSDDRFISLGGRTRMANGARSDLFVSIHANASSTSGGNGLETFYYATGKGLAQSIQTSIVRRTGMKNRGVKQARFYVLKNTAMPAALVEVGFVTGSSDAAKLSNPAFRRQMAEAIAEGILNYVKRNNL
ncbi:N-acetylmuramoyl-L-alanine amidase [Lusitaniella coriacea LEGE 07157]|uniref:N-acetylmuramoyl-L-alanine amidase n=1 Tax=Lusitaniella coriacea LEGE 07157 TaxID=945747 RepID=A0A8J7DW54_9CYAN|nr:N-acetylmuramoyl-L-alanine amidase [Lusitaniella coriacea]MBE9116241.1 N-acetylmuramoyl-L-alanine amidase [Lusitaniella coriacea LEGE 07157]